MKLRSLAAIALLALAAPALAQPLSPSIEDPNSPDTKLKQGGAPTGGGTGSAYSQDPLRDREWSIYVPNILQNSGNNCPWSGGADSTGVIVMRGATYNYVDVYARPKADSTFKALIAISWWGANVAANDTVSVSRQVEMQDPVVFTGPQLDSINVKVRGAWVADTIAYRQYVPSTNDTTYRTSAQPGEKILVVMATADNRYRMRIPLERNGVWFKADYGWIKFRVLYVYNAIGNRYPIGGPPVQCFRADYYGTR